MMKILAGIALAVFGLLLAVIAVMPFPSSPDSPYILLTVVRGGIAESVGMQEFNNKMSCEYALGYVSGITETVHAGCVEK